VSLYLSSPCRKKVLTWIRPDRRIPCAFNGLYGLRPSFDRIPYGGSSNSMEGFTVIPSVLGPMSTSLDGVKAFFRAVVDAEPWRYDPLALHMPWSEAGYALREHGGGEKLCFGMVHHNGMAKPDVPYVRALEMLKKALLAQGHTGALSLSVSLVTAAGFKH
jgi:amidase